MRDYFSTDDDLSVSSKDLPDDFMQQEAVREPITTFETVDSQNTISHSVPPTSVELTRGRDGDAIPGVEIYALD